MTLALNNKIKINLDKLKAATCGLIFCLLLTACTQVEAFPYVLDACSTNMKMGGSIDYSCH